MLKKPVSVYKLTRSYVRGVLSLYPTWPARPHGEHASLSYSSRSHNVVVTFLLPFCGLFPDLLAWSTEAIKFNFKKFECDTFTCIYVTRTYDDQY